MCKNKKIIQYSQFNQSEFGVKTFFLFFFLCIYKQIYLLNFDIKILKSL